jgi:hypothetical protein
MLFPTWARNNRDNIWGSVRDSPRTVVRNTPQPAACGPPRPIKAAPNKLTQPKLQGDSEGSRLPPRDMIWEPSEPEDGLLN